MNNMKLKFATSLTLAGFDLDVSWWRESGTPSSRRAAARCFPGEEHDKKALSGLPLRGLRHTSWCTVTVATAQAETEAGDRRLPRVQYAACGACRLSARWGREAEKTFIYDIAEDERSLASPV